MKFNKRYLHFGACLNVINDNAAELDRVVEWIEKGADEGGPDAIKDKEEASKNTDFRRHATLAEVLAVTGTEL